MGKKIFDDDEEPPVCPDCGSTECRGAVGYKCQYFESEED